VTYLLPAALGLAGFALMLGRHRLGCALGFHHRPSGVRPEMSIFWVCASCGAPVPGHLAARRSRR
jgi:hypothetical protein